MATKKAPAKKPAEKTSNIHSASSASDAVDQQLARYREMRDFHMTAEPSGASKKVTKSEKAPTLPFVIQKHAASHLHYDFRLGWNGVLKSWAVAKGPSFTTSDRRLAVQVEDHPMEYGGFEGIIPKGQYGGGTVMVWDQGTWEPQQGHEDIDAGLRDGSLKFVMHGTKIKGKWTLVRMNTHPSEKGGRWSSSSKPNWLLIKEHDEFERADTDPAITDDSPNSAITGRSLEEIASNEDHVWNSKETKSSGQAWFRKAPMQSFAPLKNQPELQKLLKEAQPDFVPPQLALEATGPPGQAGWIHELKLDGYRIQAKKSGAKVKLLTRTGLDWTHRMPAIAEGIKALSATDATIDGEVVVLTEHGTTSFSNLQSAFNDAAGHPLTYFAFDLLHLDEHNTRKLPLVDRKRMLSALLVAAPEQICLSEHLATGGEAMFHKACELHAEGIISKRADAAYASGRGGDWLKSKCLLEQEFVIGGYTLSSEGDDRIGSLLLGYYDDGKLLYAGRTGTGFTQKTKRSMLQQLAALQTNPLPFSAVPAAARRGSIWVAPKLVAQVRFATWTADNLVRQAAFLGLREDKPAKDVHREGPTVAPRPKAAPQTKADHPKADHRAAASVAAKDQAGSPPAKQPKPTGTAVRPNIRLTHPSKVVDPESKLTKQQLADYYWAVSDWMLPQIANRPLSLVRCPEGAGKPCFFQKHVNHMLPPGVGGVDIPNKKTGEMEPYITLNTAEALTGLAQMGVLEIHPWGSSNDDLEHPDRVIFDLDPDESLPWPVVCEAAAEVRKRLKKAGLESFLKTTGGKGLHVVVPIEPQLGWTEIKELAHTFVRSMERDHPERYLTKMTKSARVGKIYLDYLRNERGATAVAPYSPRARAGAHVSLPLPWAALNLPERPVYAAHDFAEWSAQLKKNPWKNLRASKQFVDPAKIKNI